MNPNKAPPMTSAIGYGTDRRRASTLRPATATSSPAISSSACPITQVSRCEARYSFTDLTELEVFGS